MTPPIFRQLTFPQAQEAASAEGKLVLVLFGGEDSSGWVAPELSEWVDANAVAIQLDREQSPLGKKWRIPEHPTALLFAGERELDRCKGARSPPELLAWLNEATANELHARKREQLFEQYFRAKSLIERSLDAEALEVSVQLWEGSIEAGSAFEKTRASLVVDALEPLLRRSEQARARFRKFRDAAEVNDERRSFNDFVALNLALGDDMRTRDWLLRATPDQAERLLIHRSARMFQAAEKGDLWAPLGRLIKDGTVIATDHLRFIERSLADPPPRLTEEDHERARRITRESSAKFARTLVRALRAAGRTADANDLDAWADSVLSKGK